jgi:MraZ protein
MFFGSYEFTVDEKGRLSIPSKMRANLSSQLYLLRGYDGCLSIYTEGDFTHYVDKLKNLEFEKEKVRLHQRILLSSVVGIDVDKQRRMQIPQKTLRDYSIGNKVLILGAIDHIEVWDVDKRNEYKSAHEKDFEKDAEDILKDEKQ